MTYAQEDLVYIETSEQRAAQPCCEEQSQDLKINEDYYCLVKLHQLYLLFVYGLEERQPVVGSTPN